MTDPWDWIVALWAMAYTLMGVRYTLILGWTLLLLVLIANTMADESLRGQQASD